MNKYDDAYFYVIGKACRAVLIYQFFLTSQHYNVKSKQSILDSMLWFAILFYVTDLSSANAPLYVVAINLPITRFYVKSI